MALDINNATFRAFTDFATKNVEAGKQKTVVRVDTAGAGSLGSLTIKAAKGDWVGIGIGRLRSLKDANNIARDLFKTAIADMFGGEDRIPDSVKDAMKMQDFGKGKPLTARRILAVKAAIDQVAEKMQTCIEETKANFDYNVDEREKCNEMIEKAFIACKGNTDAMDIVKTHISEITVNSASELRTEEGMQKKVDGLLDNLKELKELSKKNPAIYTAGKIMLKESGVALPKGMIAKLVQASNEAPINGLRKLSGSSPATSIHDVTVQLHKSIKHAMISSGAEHLEGAPEKMAVRDFVASTILSRCSKSALQNIRSALDTEDAACLQEYYSITEAGGNVHVEEESYAVQEAIKTTGTIGLNYLEILDINVNRNLDRLEPNVSHNSRIPSFDKKVDVNDIGGKTLIDRTIGLAKEIIEELAQNFIKDTVQGSGQGADAFKAALRRKIGESDNPRLEIGKRMGTTASAMMNWNICGEMKKLATGQTSQFENDIYRCGPIHLKNGDTEFQLDTKFETARDQLAQFVTGDAKATYGSLKRAERQKVHLMMAMISQETEKATEMGSELALDPRESSEAFSMGGRNEASRTYHFTKLKDGGVSFHYTMDKTIVNITTDDLDDFVWLGEGSSFKCDMDYTLKGDEFNRLADLDFSKFDDQEAKEVFGTKINMPDGSRQYPEQRLLKLVDSFQDNFKVNANCSMELSMKLNPTDEELMATEIADRR